MMIHDLLDTPWLITEAAFHELHQRSRDPEYVRMAMSFLDQFYLTNQSTPPYDLYGSVAVISCVGLFSKRSSWWSWRFTGDRVQFAITHALQNPVVKSIVLDIDSPGGTSAGTRELADYIYQARSHGKRIVGVANELCASSALWIGTSCHELVANPAAMIGSLGAIQARYDVTGMNERLGIKVFVFASGTHKPYQTPDVPITDGEKAVLTERINVLAQQFIDGVARNRKVTPQEARDQWADARVWIGQAAVDVGLADRVATLDSVVSQLSGQPVTVEEKGNPEDASSQPSNSLAGTSPRLRSGSHPTIVGSRRRIGTGCRSRIVER